MSVGRPPLIAVAAILAIATLAIVVFVILRPAPSTAPSVETTPSWSATYGPGSNSLGIPTQQAGDTAASWSATYGPGSNSLGIPAVGG